MIHAHIDMRIAWRLRKVPLVGAHQTADVAVFACEE